MRKYLFDQEEILCPTCLVTASVHYRTW
uniref:Uncharacterized protein n=1 Tax=Anguilla anguilla TaxID=7936 RepID=A0A0E9VHS5_ANGAN